LPQFNKGTSRKLPLKTQQYPNCQGKERNNEKLRPVGLVLEKLARKEKGLSREIKSTRPARGAAARRKMHQITPCNISWGGGGGGGGGGVE